ncbi:MAG TPA: hypothetical protein DEB06_06435 [Phycisphaerales bacterium]|nr:hypothetical protein [Phycisphaerales bacterium]
MSRPIDLLPSACRETLGRRARVRRWIIAYGAVVTMLAGGVVVSGAGLGERARQRASLAEEARRRWERDEEVQRLLREIAAAEQNITRYNRLAWPIRVSEAIDALSAALPRSVSVSNLLVTPREEQARALRGLPAAPARSVLVIEVEGISPSDREVAALASALEVNRVFSAVRMEYTRSTSVDGVEAREFRVVCEVDLLSKYQFVDAAPQRTAGAEVER